MSPYRISAATDHSYCACKRGPKHERWVCRIGTPIVWLIITASAVVLFGAACVVMIFYQRLMIVSAIALVMFVGLAKDS